MFRGKFAIVLNGTKPLKAYIIDTAVKAAQNTVFFEL
jgi:hypothetical protein